MRTLDPADLARLRAFARLLDTRFEIPLLRVRIGLDGLIGLVPGVGDALGGILAAWPIVYAARRGVSRAVLGRMLVNWGLDVGLGLVPLAGDVFDIFFRATTRNVALLEEHAARPRPVERASLGIVAGLVAAIVALVAAGIAVFLWVLRAVLAWLEAGPPA